MSANVGSDVHERPTFIYKLAQSLIYLKIYIIIQVKKNVGQQFFYSFFHSISVFNIISLGDLLYMYTQLLTRIYRSPLYHPLVYMYFRCFFKNKFLLNIIKKFLEFSTDAQFDRQLFTIADPQMRQHAP